MSSNYNSNTSGRPTFTHHQTQEVATSLALSKQIANDLAENDRYQYRASAVLMGNVDIEPYDAVYLDHLPGGMSGYWTVLSVRHLFGDSIPYKCEVELGTDQLGMGPKPTARAYVNVESQLGNPTNPPAPVYVNNEFISGLGNEYTPYGVTRPTAATTSVTASAPDFSMIRQPSAWRSR
jgi:hypothetical protein